MRLPSGAQSRGTTLRSISHISRLQHVLDNDADYVAALDMLAELRGTTLSSPRGCARFTGCATRRAMLPVPASETWIDEAEGRTWFLFETSRRVRDRAISARSEIRSRFPVSHRVRHLAISLASQAAGALLGIAFMVLSRHAAILANFVL